MMKCHKKYLELPRPRQLTLPSADHLILISQDTSGRRMRVCDLSFTLALRGLPVESAMRRRGGRSGLLLPSPLPPFTCVLGHRGQSVLASSIWLETRLEISDWKDSHSRRSLEEEKQLKQLLCKTLHAPDIIHP